MFLVVFFQHDKQVYLGQIKICISKQFTLLDCGKATFSGNGSLSNFFEDCPQENRTEVYYLPPPPSPWQQQIGIVQVWYIYIYIVLK